MKKYLIRGLAAAVFCGVFTSCSHDMDLGSSTVQTTVQETYEKAFITRFGEPASTQTWGFGSGKSATRGINTPSVATIPAPYTEADVTDYLATAKEPNSDNINDNYDHSTYHEAVAGHYETKKRWVDGHNEEVTNTVWVDAVAWGFNWQNAAGRFAVGYGQTWFDYANEGYSKADYDFWETYCQPYQNQDWAFYNCDNKEDATFVLMDYLSSTGRKSSWCNIYSEGKRAGYQETTTTQWVDGYEEEYQEWVEGTEAYWEYDETFVLNFKITQNYTGTIGVAATEGYNKTWNSEKNDYDYITRQDPYYARTIMVKNATWNINDNQRIGSGGIIVVADGGTINIADGKTLEMVNHARLVVLRGGTITGKGNILVTNGTGEGEENYNAGTISIEGVFNNNFGKFYNYGTFRPTIYAASSQESNFYNHGIVHIKTTKQYNSYLSQNCRIFNACQWYCEEDMRGYIIELVQGSSFIVGGELNMNAGNDGTSDPTYVAMASGAYLKAGTLSNNLTNWVGPTENGYAVVELGGISYLNVDGNNPVTSGYFINNLAISVDDKTLEDRGTNNFNKLNSWYLNGYGYYPGEPVNFEKHAPNGAGNLNAIIVDKGKAPVTIPASTDAEGNNDFVLGESGCTPGYTGTTPPPVIVEDDADEIVVLAEDLTIDDVKPDFDFNDVVFKVTRYTSGEKSGQVWVTILAAGGTLPLTVDGKEVHAEFARVNPDKVIVTTTMINTAENAHEAYETPSFQVANPSGSKIEEIANNIAVVVTKFGEPITLTAPTGGVPAKIAVNTDFLDYGWCDERQDIDERFNNNGQPLFRDYVRGNLGDDWYTNLKTSNKQ